MAEHFMQLKIFFLGDQLFKTENVVQFSLQTNVADNFFAHFGIQTDVKTSFFTHLLPLSYHLETLLFP